MIRPLNRTLSLTLLAAMAAGSILVLSTGAEARARKGKSATNLPPLPSPTVSLDFDGDESDSDIFLTPAQEELAESGGTEEELSPTWRLSDWRQAMESDQGKLLKLERALASRLAAMQQQNFPVAVRYIRGIHAAVSELAKLASQTIAVFDEDHPEPRLRERTAAPPEAARRLRLFVDRAEALYVSADKYLARSVAITEGEKVVRLQDED